MKEENIDKELEKEWKNSRYKDFPYSKQRHNLADAFVRLIYDDGTVVEPLSKNYNGLKRKGMKSVTIIVDEDPIFTLPIVDDILIYRRRNMIPPNIRAKELSLMNGKEFSKTNPKRCFILATKGSINYIWDSDEVKTLTKFGKIEPYTMPNLRDDENWE